MSPSGHVLSHTGKKGSSSPLKLLVPALPVTSGCFAPPTRPEFFGGGKTFGGAKHSASGSRGKKFSSPAARSERKKETKKGIRLSHFFGLAQVKKNFRKRKHASPITFIGEMTLKHFVCLSVSLTFGNLPAAGLHLVQQQHPDIHEAALTPLQPLDTYIADQSWNCALEPRCGRVVAWQPVVVCSFEVAPMEVVPMEVEEGGFAARSARAKEGWARKKAGLPPKALSLKEHHARSYNGNRHTARWVVIALRAYKKHIDEGGSEKVFWKEWGATHGRDKNWKNIFKNYLSHGVQKADASGEEKHSLEWKKVRATAALRHDESLSQGSGSAGSGVKPLFIVQEQKVFDWILGKRQAGLQVTTWAVRRRMEFELQESKVPEKEWVDGRSRMW